MGVDGWAEVWVGVPLGLLLRREEVKQNITRYDTVTGVPYQKEQTVVNWFFNGNQILGDREQECLNEDQDFETALKGFLKGTGLAVGQVSRYDPEGGYGLEDAVAGMRVGRRDPGLDSGNPPWGTVEFLDVPTAMTKVREALALLGSPYVRWDSDPRVFLLRSVSG